MIRMAYGVKSLRKEYDESRAKRDVLIGIIKKKRQELANRTFTDLDSRGKNPYFKQVREQEQKLVKEYYKEDDKLNKIDRKISDKLNFKIDSKKKENVKKSKRLTIYDIKRRVAETSPYFFSKDTMKFNNQKLKDFFPYRDQR